MTSEARAICDYEGSAYRTEFWGQGRDYEDAVERVALKRMLPATGHRLIEIGAGYGRLAPLYDGYEEVVFFDYALSQLQKARELWGESGPNGCPRYIYVTGDFYDLPFSPRLFDTVTMVRALHHATDAAAVLQEIAQILAPEGAFILEFANKRNLKAILRYLAGRQNWSPFERKPVEFVELNFDFHPAWIRERLNEVGLRVRQQRTVSHFRLDLLKRMAPTRLLVALDRICQPTGALWQLSPSVFLRCEADPSTPSAPAGSFFRCTICGSTMLVEEESVLSCLDCGARFAVHDDIYDFKSPIEEPSDERG